MHITTLDALLTRTHAYTLAEGGHWIKGVPTDGHFHALLLEDGVEWDIIHGFRDGWPPKSSGRPIDDPSRWTS